MIRLGDPVAYSVPTVTTDRLILRTWLPADVAPYAAWAADPAMSAYTGSSSGESAVWDMLAHQIGHWALRGFGMWALEDRASGDLVGRAGLYEGPDWPGIEVAWTIRHDRWGQGLATEGGAAALEFAFTQVRADRVVSLMHRDNIASQRVAEKLGMTFDRIEEMTIFRGDPTAHYRIDRDTWLQRAAAHEEPTTII